MKSKCRIIFVLIGIFLVMGCSGQDIENDWLLKGIVDTMPQSLQPGGYRDLQEKKKEQERVQQAPDNSSDIWRCRVLVDLDTGKEISDSGTSGEEWPDYRSTLDTQYNENNYPINGVGVLQFIGTMGDQAHRRAKLIRSFKIFLAAKYGVKFYKEIEDKE